MNTLTQRKLDTILPGYTLVDVNGEIAIQAPDPGNEIIANIFPKTGRITVLESKQKDLIATALGSMDGYIVENEETVRERKEIAETGVSVNKNPRAMNVGLAGSIIQSLPESWGDGPTTTLLWNKDHSCTISTRNKRIAKRLFGYYQKVSGVVFDGKLSKKLSCTLPAHLIDEPESIIFK